MHLCLGFLFSSPLLITPIKRGLHCPPAVCVSPLGPGLSALCHSCVICFPVYLFSHSRIFIRHLSMSKRPLIYESPVCLVGSLSTGLFSLSVLLSACTT